MLNLTKGKPHYALNQPLPLCIEAIIDSGLWDANSRDERERLKRRVDLRVQELANDLRIPVDYDLALRPAAPDDLPKGQLFAIFINGAACRVDHTFPRSEVSPQWVLGDLIGQTLFLNRSLFVTDVLIARLCSELISNGPDPQATQIVQYTVTEVIERGFDIDTAFDLCRIRLEDSNDQKDCEYEAELFIAIRFSNSITVEVGRALYDAAFPFSDSSAEEKEHGIAEMISLMRDGLFYELGIRFPPVSIVLDETLNEHEFRVRINRLRGPVHQGLKSTELLVNDTVDRLILLNVRGWKTVNPANGTEAAIISSGDGGVCEQAGLTTWDSPGFLILSLSVDLRRHAPVFFTIAQAEVTLGRFNEAFPMLVFNILERYSTVAVTNVMRELLREEISIRDFRAILEALLEINGTMVVDFDKYIVFTSSEAHLVAGNTTFKEFTTADYTEFVRAALKRYIGQKYLRGGNTLVVYLVDPQIERIIKDSDQKPMTEQERSGILASIYGEVGNLPLQYPEIVILTTGSVRRKLRLLIEKEFPNLPVLSYQELPPYLNIQPIARISLE